MSAPKYVNYYADRGIPTLSIMRPHQITGMKYHRLRDFSPSLLRFMRAATNALHAGAHPHLHVDGWFLFIPGKTRSHA